MGFFFNKKGSIISDIFKLAEEHHNMQPDWMYELSLYDNHLEIEQKAGGKFSATLKYSQIIDVQYQYQNKTFEKKQSAVGRGIIGGLLAGPIGACVGAFTAIANNKFYILIRGKRLYQI